MQKLVGLICGALFDYPLDLSLEESDGRRLAVFDVEAPRGAERELITVLFGESTEYAIEERGEGRLRVVIDLDALPPVPMPADLGPRPRSGCIGRVLITLHRAGRPPSSRSRRSA
jgi:hypothetical protein